MKTLNELVEIVKKDMDSIQVPYNKEIPVVLNYKMRSTAGKCKYVQGQAFKVEINGNMFENESEGFIKDIICHELIHSASSCAKAGHRGNWLFYANKMSKAGLGYKITRCYKSSEVSGSYKRKSNRKYLIICQNCGKVYSYSRRSKAIQAIESGIHKYRCNVCKSSDLSIKESL